MIEASLLMAGVETAASDGGSFPVYEPATEQVMARVARATVADVELAVSCAADGFRVWSGLAPKQREAILLAAAEIMRAQGEQRYLDLLMRESGSVINKARFEINYTVDLLRTAAGEVRRLYGETFPNDDPGRMSMVIREPLGVVAVVSPYNAPLALLAKMVAFPLAAGNAVVVKPSEETPLIALEFGKLLVEAGLPAAAISVIPGYGADCGAALVGHPGIRGIALTGSSRTGATIGATAMKRMVRMQLELGGKSALLVLRDFEPAQAASIVATGMFNHAGQICMANSRVIVERPLFDEFCAALKNICENMVIGDQSSTESVYGPLINRAALEKIQQHQSNALQFGASLLCGGEVHEGLVYQPTVLLNTPSDCSAWRDETFGPLLNVIVVDDFEQAVVAANDSDYGLSAAVLTYNYQLGLRAARALNSGAVHIGMHAFQSNAMAPVGGVGFSGMGRSGGAYSTQEFTELKWISFELGT